MNRQRQEGRKLEEERMVAGTGLQHSEASKKKIDRGRYLWDRTICEIKRIGLIRDRHSAGKQGALDKWGGFDGQVESGDLEQSWQGTHAMTPRYQLKISLCLASFTRGMN
jgi:hypothetical protein